MLVLENYVNRIEYEKCLFDFSFAKFVFGERCLAKRKAQQKKVCLTGMSKQWRWRSMHEICFHNGLLQRKDSSCANPSVRTTGCQRASLAGRFRSARRLAKPVSAAANGGVLLFFGFGSDGVMFLCCTSQPERASARKLLGKRKYFRHSSLVVAYRFLR